MATNKFLEQVTLQKEINGIKLDIIVKALSFGQATTVATEVVQLAMSTAGNTNMVDALNKVLKLCVEVKSGDEKVDLSDLPIDIIGEITDKVYDINFTSSKLASWKLVVQKVQSLMKVPAK